MLQGSNPYTSEKTNGTTNDFPLTFLGWLKLTGSVPPFEVGSHWGGHERCMKT